MSISGSFGTSSPFSSASARLRSARRSSRAFFLVGSFHAACNVFQPCNVAVHADHDSRKPPPGCKSSMRVASFFAYTQSRKILAASSSPLHAKTTSSKPSDFIGKLKPANALDKTSSATSGKVGDRCHNLRSSSESSTTAMSPPPSSFASAANISSSFFSSPFCCSLSSGWGLFASSARLLRSSTMRFRSSSMAAFFAFASTFARLSARRSCWTRSLYSALGSPIMTMATFLNSEGPNFNKASLRSSLRRFALSSGTMKFLRVVGITWKRTRLTDESSKLRMPNLRAGLSLEAPWDLGLGTPLLTAHSAILRSLISSKSGCSSKKPSTQSK
mmetsp:Transcript_111531/g.322383  ORF Transcript_111531/g.322383 Transcript_111531/m.322383 type:complete len:331 (+) Transcript_111531:575-1567(+)